MIHNNLKAKAKLILEYYINEMDFETIDFYIDLTTNSYLTTEKIQRFTFCDFRYIANSCGLI